MEPPSRPTSGKAGRRAPLACIACRKRKGKCSGDWPSCNACKKRKRFCEYVGNDPQVIVGLQLHKPARKGKSDTTQILPEHSIVVEAFQKFFEYYGDSAFCFFRDFSTLDDLERQEIPVPLQLCVLAVTARFIEPCYKIYNGTIEASEHFAALARSSMMDTFDEISLLNMQCNLLLSMHWTGQGDENKAWFQLGIATRIAQALRLSFEDSFRQDDLVTAEVKRRTFWCCFALDRLMANGSDRRLTFNLCSITTRLPNPRSTFLLGSNASTTTIGDPSCDNESLLAYTLRIIDILGNIVDWSGAGGRHREHRCPWMPDMPIAQFERQLATWEDNLPSHIKYTPANLAAHTAIGEAKAFCAMHLFFYNAQGHLHREYIPVVFPTTWDPGNGPCDGPEMRMETQNPGWWAWSIRKGVTSAVSISNIYSTMAAADMLPYAHPFLGYCLMTASTFHIWCSLNKWRSCEGLMGEPAKKLLIDDLRHLIQCQESWPVAAYWVKALRMHYEQNSLVSGAKVAASPQTAAPLSQLRAKLLHFGQSDQEPEEWKGHRPPRSHDLFDLFGGKLASQEIMPQNNTEMSFDDLDMSSDALLRELLGMA